MQHQRTVLLITGASILSMLAGCSAVPSSPYALLVRPRCRTPAPLEGTYDPRAPGFIVQLHDTVNVALEAARLAQAYAFTPTSVLTSVHMVTTPALSDTTVAALRCEATVVSVAHDAIYAAG